MSENWKGTESQLFAEFVEHREMFMIMRKWWRPGYRISFSHSVNVSDQGHFHVVIQKMITDTASSWEAHGFGRTLDAAAKSAAAQAAFRD